MNREQATAIIFAEMLRLELAPVNSELHRSYTDGGRSSGARNDQLARAVAEAYAQTQAALASIAS